MTKVSHTKEFLGRLSDAWGSEEFLWNVSRATSVSIQSELLGGSAAAAHLDDPYAIPQLAQHAAVLSFMTERISNEAGPMAGLPEEATANAHRLAKLWESLSRICPPDAKVPFALNASCAYELAGYQANARCMARQADAGTGGEGPPNIQKIVGAFLQRKFIRMRFDCKPIMAEPNYEQVGSIRHVLASASMATGLYDFAGHMLSGAYPKIDSIMEDLDDAERLFYMSGFPLESALAHSVKSLLGPMWSRSTWSNLDWAGGGNFAWGRYLVLLSRGLETPVQSGSSISEMWPSQLEAVKRGLLSSNESKVVRMPTSTGKTRIAEMSILHALTGGTAPSSPRRCIYVAPYRALVTEVTRSLSLVFPDMGFTVSGMDGAYDTTPLDVDGVNGKPDILVLTPEKLDIIDRTNPDSLDDIALFVVDEGHVIGQGDRGTKIEMLLTRLRRRFSKSRFILLSAMLSDDAIQKFATWLRCKGTAPGGDGIITTDWRPTMQRIAKLEWANKRFRLTYEPLKINLRQHEMVEDPIVVRKFDRTDARSGRKKTRKFPSLQKAEIAAELALKYSSLGPVLVYSTSPKNVMSVASKLHERVALSREAGEGDFRFQVGNRRSADVSADWLGPEHKVTLLLRSGIAVHHGGLPHALRQAIESDMVGGKIHAVVATNTLSQGASLPVRTIIVHSCRRFDKKTERMVRIPDGEYWNIAGRAGRAGHETEGTVIHITMTPSDVKDFEHYASARDKHGDEADSSLGRLLANLAQNRISDDELARVLDPEILGIMVEEGAGGGCEEMVKGVIIDSLAAQGREDDPGIKSACDRIERRARSIGADAPELTERGILRAYGCTGLSMQSCSKIMEYVDENSDVLPSLITPNGAGNAYELARLIMGALDGVSEMDGELEYAGDRDSLLESWMNGDTVSDALGANEMDGAEMERAAKFIGTAFGHYMPWGISAFMKIAAARLSIAEDDLPDHVRYLPEMVRHGMPAPEHSWAMRLGVPTKSAAMRVCDRLDPSTPRELARMISEMGVEDLTEHGIGADTAADIAQAARRLHPNPLLRGGRSLEDVAGEPVRIVGIGRLQWYATRLAAGDGVEIRRDYDDLADRNAMEALAGGRRVGYLERDVAQYLAPLVDAGMSVSARVASVEGGGGGAPRVAVALSVSGGPLGHDQGSRRRAPRSRPSC